MKVDIRHDTHTQTIRGPGIAPLCSSTLTADDKLKV